MNIITLLVTGGSGLVGHALQKIKKDNAVFISSSDYDLTIKENVIKMFEKYKPENIIHLAAKVGGIKDNIEHPADFIYQNVLINTYIVHYAYKYKVKKMIATLSNCAYPDVSDTYPLTEEQLYNGLPTDTNLAYGYSKRLLDVQVKSYRRQHECNFNCAIPCSIYGPFDNFNDGESHFLAALIKKIFEANIGNDDKIILFGSGKSLRQYIFSEDVAKILLLLLERYNDEEPVNIATEENLSIKKIAESAISMTNSKLNIEFDKKYPDGQYRKDLSNKKLLNLIGDLHFTSLSEGIKKTYDWYTKYGDI